jgi:AcrR family transcriptional regulator
MQTVSRTWPQTPDVSHNLAGQRLGRKGLETHERIVQAALRLLRSSPSDVPVTLTAVSREASVGMTTLYLYFPDIGELVLAALNRIMATADDAFLDRLRSRWPDDGLEACCLDFLRAHLQFWRRHARILHMRNSFADKSDMRFLEYRNRISYPLIEMLVQQMDGDPATKDSHHSLVASVILAGLERLATVITTANFPALVRRQGVKNEHVHVYRMLGVEARLIALGIRDARDTPKRQENIVCDAG